MKAKVLIGLGLLICGLAYAPELPPAQINKIADAIYRVEGSEYTRHPYGIMSFARTYESPIRARQICVNTISNNYKRWNKTSKQVDYITFLGSRYCPQSADPIGNKNWVRNMKLILKDNTSLLLKLGVIHSNYGNQNLY